jgi:hypothetical protein
MRRAVPPGPVQTRTFEVPQIPVIHTAADMPLPSVNPAPFYIAQVQTTHPREFLFWVRTTFALQVAVMLTNADGHSVTVTGTSP